jgi:hypothetical protein
VSLNALKESNDINAKKLDAVTNVASYSNKVCQLNASVIDRVKGPTFSSAFHQIFFSSTDFSKIVANESPVDTCGRTGMTGENRRFTQLLQKRPEIHVI